MQMINKNDKKVNRLRKGFSLVETIIAMLIITIAVAASATTMLFVETRLDKVEATYFFVREITNLLECYKQDGFDVGYGGSVASYYQVEYPACDEATPFGASHTDYSFYYDHDLIPCLSEQVKYTLTVTVDTNLGFKAKVTSLTTTVYEMTEFYRRFGDFGSARVSYQVGERYATLYCNSDNIGQKVETAIAGMSIVGGELTLKLYDDFSFNETIIVPDGCHLIIYTNGYSVYHVPGIVFDNYGTITFADEGFPEGLVNNTHSGTVSFYDEGGIS